jgi:hypothetical protein
MGKPVTKGLCIRIHTGNCLSGQAKVKARNGLVCRRCLAYFKKVASEAAAKQSASRKYGRMSVQVGTDLKAAEAFLTEVKSSHKMK